MFPDSLSALLDEARRRVDAELDARLPADDSALAEAMRYATLGQGKRVRPALVFAVADALTLDRRRVDAAAASVEMVHAFSLVHDDLPALDDDDLRRGRETVHVAFDEPTAILAGDALLNLAFRVLAEEPRSASPEARCRAVAALAVAVGTNGMIGGQMRDLRQARAGGGGDLADLEATHRGKTGSLMRVCGELPAIYAAVDAALERDVARGCEDLGLMFQIRDDLLDVTEASAELGKTAGKDREQNKLTYVSLLGVEGASRRLVELRERVAAGFDQLPGDATAVQSLVVFVAERKR